MRLTFVFFRSVVLTLVVDLFLLASGRAAGRLRPMKRADPLDQPRRRTPSMRI